MFAAHFAKQLKTTCLMLKKLLTASFFLLLLVRMSAQNPFFKENFNAGTVLPVNWSQVTASTDGGWLVGTPSALSSSFFPINPNTGNAIATNDDGCNCDKSEDILYLPSVDLTGHDDSHLIFDLYYSDQTYDGATEDLVLLVSTNGGQDWTTLEDFTGDTDWRTEMVSLNQFNGTADLQLAFKYNDDGGWLYGAAIDNLRFLLQDSIVRSSVKDPSVSRYVSAIPSTLTGYTKMLSGADYTVVNQIRNDAFEPITSFTANWTINGENFSQNYDGLNLALGESYEFSADLTDVAGAAYDVSISDINGTVDDDSTDNASTIAIVTPAPGRKVVLEEGTGTWCQWCPRGAVMMDFIHAEYPELAIPIAVHNGDPMKVTVYDNGMGTMIGGYPSGLVDRANGEFDPLDFDRAMIERLAIPTPVEITQDVVYDPLTREISVTSHLNFLEELNGNYRIAMVITEDGVTGTSNTYRQVNIYAGGAYGPMGGYENLPNPVPANQMVYDHVARTIQTGFTGAAGSVPASNAAGSTVDFESTYIHPATQDVTEMHAITMLIDATSGEIVNAQSTPAANFVVPTVSPLANVEVDVYPNPASREATVSLAFDEPKDVQLRLTDVSGKVVYENNLGKITGEQKIPVRVQNLNAGNYMMNITIDGAVVSKPVVVVK